MRRMIVPAVLALSVQLPACGDLTSPELEVPSTVVITPSQVRVESIGQEIAFDASVLAADDRVLDEVAVTWQSADPEILEPVGNGVFRTIGLGTAKVKASTGRRTPGVDPGAYDSGLGPTGEASVEVDQRPVQLIMGPDTTRLWALGESRQVSAAVVDAMGTPMIDPPTLEWEVEDPTVSTISDGGWVSAWLDGTTSVTVRAGKLSGEAVVMVSATIPYTACYSFTAASADDEKESEEQCATVQITARARND